MEYFRFELSPKEEIKIVKAELSSLESYRELIQNLPEVMEIDELIEDLVYELEELEAQLIW